VDGSRLLLVSGGRLLAINAAGVVTVLGENLLHADYLAVSDGWIAMGAGTQVILMDDKAKVRQRLATPGELRGLVLRPGGRVWAAHWMKGLGYFDGTSWHPWTHATGLPTNAVRALVLDRGGRLWLGASQSAVIEVEAAERQIVALKPPALLPATVFADACAAARSRVVATAIDDPTGIEPVLVFNGDVWCPDRYKKNASDGAFVASPDGRWVLSLAFDARNSRSHCDANCSQAQLEYFARAWSLTRHHRQATGSIIKDEMAKPNPMPTTVASSLAISNDGQIAAVTYSGDLFRHQKGVWQKADAADLPWPQDSELLMLRFDSAGALWVQSRISDTGNGVVHHFDGKFWNSWPLERFGGQYAPVMRTTSRGLLLATLGQVSLIESPQLLESDPGVEQGIRRFGKPDGRVSDLAEERADGVWLAYDNDRPGIAYLNSRGQLKRLTGREGLFAEQIVRIALDGEGRLWLQATDGRVGVYDSAALLKGLPQ
jgi:ligand-binding sensor domain-containing protein